MSTPETPPRWRKSSHSQNGDCVEWATGKRHVYVQDSSYAPGPALKFTYSVWQTFITEVKSSEVDFQNEGLSGFSGGV